VLVPRVRIPYPILMVLGGLALGFVPGMPELELPPDLVLVGVLPPLLYGAAFFTPLRDLRANVRPVGMLAVGLVLLTMVAVAVVAHAIVPGLPWASAFVLGAVVSPTDPIAATAIMRRLGVPRRVVAIVEGESLVNDGTALVAYRFAVTAAVTGAFTLWEAGLSFVFNVLGGVAVGLGVGWIVRQVRRRLDYPPAEVTISLLTGYFAYLPAELVGVSAVIAAVTAGIYLGWHTPELTNAEVRLLGESTWQIVTFVLNALLFTLIGLQLPVILDELDPYSSGDLLWWAVAVTLTVILARLLWVYPAAWLPRRFSRRLREREPMPQNAQLAVIWWSGMRGAVSLAAALAIPLSTDAGQPFPGRSLILFLTFAVIVGTLVVQGLTLPAVIRLCRLEDDGAEEAREEARARIEAAEAALGRLDELVGEDWVRPETADRIRGGYGFRRERFSARFDDRDGGAIEEQSLAYQRLRRELLDAERGAVLDLRRSGAISDDVARRISRDLDLEEARLDA
jgi:CPA1 family monovalent cation:H+ antiporter